MCTSEKTLKTNFQQHFAGMIFLALFGAFYEAFSHGVYSYFMTYAFAIPLLLGVTLYAILLAKKKYPSLVFLRLWNAGTVVLSWGSVYEGVLEIYGTTNRLMIVYPIAGGLLLASGLISIFITSRKTIGPCPAAE